MFIEEYLQDLRRDRFAPAAALLYARRVARRVRENLYTSPGTVRSIWTVGIGFFAAAFFAAGVIAFTVDRRLAYEYFLQTSLWILPGFTFVTLHLELLRDRDGYRLSALNVPIVLTLMRLSMVPGIILFLVERRFVPALVTYLIAALTDVLDGWWARRFGQVTRLGVVMDPLVDIVFNLALFAGLVSAGLLPTWVFAMAALRYGVLLVGGAYLNLFVGPVRIHPTAFGRLSGVVLSALVVLLTVLHIVGGRLGTHLLPLTESALGVLLAATVFQVVILGWYNLRLMTGAAAAARGRVVGDVRWGAP